MPFDGLACRPSTYDASRVLRLCVDPRWVPRDNAPMPFFGRDGHGLTDDDSRMLLRSVLLWSVGVTVVSGLMGVLVTGHWQYLPLVLAPVPVQLLILWAASRFAARKLTPVYLVVVSCFFFVGGLADRGTSGQAFYGLVMVVQLTALMFGLRGVALFLPFVGALGVGLALVEQKGLLGPAVPRGPFEALLPPLGAFVLTAAGSIVVHRRLTRALGQAQTQALVTARANTQLSHEIERRTQMELELHASVKNALEASQIKSSFLANVSHELRTPMNAVVGLTDLLLQDQPTDSQRDALETIRTSSDALLSLLNDILDLSKIESGAVRFEALPTSPAAVADEVRKLMAAKALGRGIGLRCEVDPSTPANVLADPTRLRQVLLNLVGNAVKFTESGEVVMHVSWAKDQLTIAVRDSGIGIRKEELARIFQPFVQADESTTRRFGGTGLGLTIVQRLVEAQQGTVTVESQQDKGSCFTITLPASRTAHRSRESSGNLPVVAVARFSLKVLVADDNPINEKVALKMLEHLGVKADVARNGREAVELACSAHYDVILMDIQMPEMDGLEATRVLRQRLGTTTRIVAMTANAMAEDRARATEAGCDGFLAKPVRLEELTRALRRVQAKARTG
jgi:signal transduction histidine kinase/ActR/RegA family two-component response regulator